MIVKLRIFDINRQPIKNPRKIKNKFSKSRLIIDESMELYIPIKYKLCERLIPGISIAIADTIPLINSVP